MTLQIYQTFHKEFPRNKNISWIKPITVNNFKMLDEQSDSIGVNISHLNPYYCELTAQYWALKNTRSNFIGFYHYRRYLNYLSDTGIHENSAININQSQPMIDFLTSENQLSKLMTLLNFADVVIPKKMLCLPSISGQYLQAVKSDPWHLFIEILQNKYSNEINASLFFDNLTYSSVCNMFVMKWDLYEVYCNDMFKIIDTIFNIIGMNYDVYNNRYPGFLAERFLGFWLYVNKVRTVEVPMIVISQD
jgi:hypothetical protein